MDIVYWKSEIANFGDELNSTYWSTVLGCDPKSVAKGEAILGIGSILDYDTTSYSKVHVLGTGSGFEHLNIPNINSYQFWYVRGPLTAKSLGLDKKLAITDPAILIQDLYDIQPAKKVSGKITFLPHYLSAMNADWGEVCSRAGIHYRTPMSSLEDICNDVSSSELVIAESLHGAIIADMYRIPWILAATPPIARSSFKWHDWCASINLRYEPVLLPWLHTRSIPVWQRVGNYVKCKSSSFGIGPDRWINKRYAVHGESEIDLCSKILLNTVKTVEPAISDDQLFCDLKSAMHSALNAFSNHVLS